MQISDDIVRGALAPGASMSRARQCAKPSDCWSGAASWRRGRIAAPSWLGPASRCSPILKALRELEGLCAGFGAMRMTSDERAQLARINASLLAAVRGGDPQRYHELNESFHAAIYTGSHNTYLARPAADDACPRRPFSRAQFRTGGRLARSGRAREHPRCHRQQRGAGGFDRHALAHRERLRRYWHLINRAVASRPRTPASCRSSKCPGRLLPPRPPPGSP